MLRLELLPSRLSTLCCLGCAFLLCLLGCSASEPASETVDDSVQLAPWYSFGGMFPSGERPEYEIGLPLSPVRTKSLVKHGSYLVRAVADCGYCHEGVEGRALSGGKLVRDSSGIGPAPNITPERTTGVGEWSIDEIVRAFRENLRKDGSPLSEEVHTGYRWMSNQDARAIAAYLRSLEPVEAKHDESLKERSYGLFHRRPEIDGYVPALSSQQASVGYGRYLVQSVASCQRCHSAEKARFDETEILSGSTRLTKESLLKRATGILLDGVDPSTRKQPAADLLSSESRKALQMAQHADAAEQSVIAVPPGAPDIRGSTGLRSWTKDEIVQYLDTGKNPQGAQVESADCPWDAYRMMSTKDKQAIANYIGSL